MLHYPAYSEPRIRTAHFGQTEPPSALQARMPSAVFYTQQGNALAQQSPDARFGQRISEPPLAALAQPRSYSSFYIPRPPQPQPVLSPQIPNIAEGQPLTYRDAQAFSRSQRLFQPVGNYQRQWLANAERSSGFLPTA